MYRKAYEASGKRYEGQHSEGDEKERRLFQQFRLTVEH
jgi:hypothetical protein